MATRPRTVEDLRREIAAERNELAGSLEDLRAGVGAATDVKARVREHLPLAVAAAAGTGFVLFGGIGATVRLIARTVVRHD